MKKELDYMNGPADFVDKTEVIRYSSVGENPKSLTNVSTSQNDTVADPHTRRTIPMAITTS